MNARLTEDDLNDAPIGKIVSVSTLGNRRVRCRKTRKGWHPITAKGYLRAGKTFDAPTIVKRGAWLSETK